MPLIDPFAPTILRHTQVPQLTVHVIPFGINVTRIIVTDPATDRQHDVIAGPEDERDHWAKGRTFLGPIVGRYANRLPSGKQAFEGGEVDVPEFSASGVSLHGGPAVYKEINAVEEEGTLSPQLGPLDQLVWTRLRGSRQSQFFGAESPSRPSGSSAIFGVLSQGVDQRGYPGTIRVEVRFSIELSKGEGVRGLDGLGASAGALRVEYRARIVHGDACTATPLNLTHHWGFNLSASDDEARTLDEGRVDNHTLRMFGTTLHTLDLDEKNVPTGILLPCTKGGEHDWLDEGEHGFGQTLIRSGGLPQGYDHFYAWGAPHEPEDHSTRLLLRSPSTRLSLAFKSDRSGVQVYMATGQSVAPAKAEDSGGAKKILHAATTEDKQTGNSRRSFVALEFAHPHATFLHKDYQEIAQDDTVLRKGQQYDSWVELEIFKA